MLIAGELIEAGTGRRQQHNVAFGRQIRGLANGRLQRLGAGNRDRCADLRFDLCRSCTDCVHTFYALCDQQLQFAVVAALVLAAEDEVNVGWERFQRLDRRINIGSLGIVVVLHPAQRGNVFKAVLDGSEILDGTSYRHWLNSGGHADGNGSQHVLHVVRTLQSNFFNRHDLDFFTSTIKNYAAPHIGSAPDLMLAAEP